MQTWRGCLPIIGYFTGLQERHAMTQTSEPANKPEHSEGERARGNGAQTTNAECHAISDNSEHLPFAGIGVPASRSARAARPSAWWDKLRIQQIAGAATAFLFAGLAPALVMAALWHTAKVAPFAFVFTFAFALCYAVLLGLPLFLVFRSMGWINVVTCVIFGFAVGAAPAGVLTWPLQHPELDASASLDGALTIINGVITAAGWVSYVKPLIYFGLFGALGGFAFWVALIWIGSFGNADAALDRSRGSRAELRHPVKSHNCHT